MGIPFQPINIWSLYNVVLLLLLLTNLYTGFLIIIFFIYYYLLVGLSKCASNPCKNGATCVSGAAGFVCSCMRGYTGRRCESMLSILIFYLKGAVEEISGWVGPPC